MVIKLYLSINFQFFFSSVSGETKIGLKEFIDIQTEAEKASFFKNDSQAELIEALKCFDASNDNTISKEDLRGILSEYDDAVIDDVFKAVGVYDDGKLSITGTRGFEFYLGTVSLKFHIMVLHIQRPVKRGCKNIGSRSYTMHLGYYWFNICLLYICLYMYIYLGLFYYLFLRSYMSNYDFFFLKIYSI